MMSNLQNKLEGEKSIYKGSNTMWKLNPGVRTITLTTVSNYTCKLLTKETENGADTNLY